MADPERSPYDDLMAAGVHETRRPLALAHGYLDMLRDGSLGALNPRQRRALDRIEEKVTEARGQLDRINVINRLQRDTVNPVDLILEDEVRDAIARAVPKADLLGGRLHLSADDGPTRVRADRSLLAQVLDNLLDNALTYSDGPPCAWVEVSAEPRPAVRVHDAGLGFSSAAAARAFEPGYRARPDDDQRPGSGLGLHLSRSAARRMGGSLALERTRPGAGSTFLLELTPS